MRAAKRRHALFARIRVRWHTVQMDSLVKMTFSWPITPLT
jgi:hypothetical protein